MNNRLHQKYNLRLAIFTPLLAGLILSPSILFAQDDEEEEDVFELSPFVVDASDDMGYYASQSLAGGRLSTDIINTGSSIEVVTADFMDDIGANDIQELLQYTTSTEIGGNLGNFVGGDVDIAEGNVNTASTQRNPDQNSRIRGLARPDNTRDFFKTDIPFDQYNTERIDINRGSNSFLFGLGSPAGLINNQLAKAHFRDSSRIRFRLGSGGDRPSYRGEFDFNRVVIKDKLAIRVAAMANRTQYRQEPKYRNDDRIYGALTYHPFDNNKKTTIRAHWESGDTVANNPNTVLPTQNLDMWVKWRAPFNGDLNTRYWRQQYGPSAGDAGRLRWPEELLNEGRETYPYWPTWDTLPGNRNATGFQRPQNDGIIGNMGSNGYTIVFDGSNGENPSDIVQIQLRGANEQFYRPHLGRWGLPNNQKNGWQRVRKTIDGQRVDFWHWRSRLAGDPWWDPWAGRTGGNISMRRYNNSKNDASRGIGWFNQGFVDLDTYDFSKSSLDGNNDYFLTDFYNYNITLEQILLDGKAGLEVAFDHQNHVRDVWTSFTAGGAQIAIDINETIPQPQYDANGNVIYPQYHPEESRGANPNSWNNPPHLWNAPVVGPDGLVVGGSRPNPNFGRPYIITRTGRGYNINDRTTLRATAFYKLDFEEYSESRPWMRWLGAHTFSLLGDTAEEDYSYLGSNLRSLSDDWDVGAHIHDNSARKITTAARQVGSLVYIGPPVQSYLGDSVWDPNTPLSMSDIILEPANYNLVIPDDFAMEMTYWNKGPDAEAAGPREVGRQELLNGDESWQKGVLKPRWIPQEGVQLRHTEIKSWAINAQSFFFNRHLVVNTGYREDYIESWLNRNVQKTGEDRIPDVSPEAFRWQDGEYSEVEKGPDGSGTFGYGAVLHWPKNIIKLPESMDVTFHYNYSKNFVPDASRQTLNERQEVIRLATPEGESSDYGVTFQLFDRRLIVRLNWYENKLFGADSTLNNVFNQNISRMFAAYSRLNRFVVDLDSTDDTINGQFDGVINADDIENARDYEFDDDGEIIPDSGQTDEEVIADNWPEWEQVRDARDELWRLLTTTEPFSGDPTGGLWQLKLDRDRLTIFEDGNIDNEWLNGLTDLEDISAEGFEVGITFNPTRSWRMRINVAQQETIRTNIAPDLSRFLEGQWVPWLIEYGTLDWSNAINPNGGDTFMDNANTNLLKYFTTKLQEGLPTPEVREWRVNLVTNYTFNKGRLRGFQFGGSARWQSKSAIGYPLITAEVFPGQFLKIGDVDNPYWGSDQWSFDLQFGYRKQLWNDVNWQIQVNLRNLQNLSSDKLSVLTAQPDGSPAKVRWDPPFQIQLTNTFRW
ncbi:MAG: TonB-dependent receptor plug domain-containing protein [Puniceicoccaceae bacterium]